MDQTLQQKIDEARKNGYTDEEIQQYLATSQESVPTQVPIDRSEEYTGLAQGMGLDTLGKVALGVGAYYGGKGLLGAAGRAMGRGIPGPAGPMGPRGPIGPPAPPPAPPVEPLLSPEFDRALGVRQNAPAQVPTQPTAQPTAQPPVQAPATQPTQVTRPAPGPVRPVETSQQGMIDRTQQIVRQAAANKALQNMARASVPLSLSMFSPELGPQTPSVGRMRGMEINPMTRKPWTPQEIKQYESNTMAYDSMLGPVQARR